MGEVEFAIAKIMFCYCSVKGRRGEGEDGHVHCARGDELVFEVVLVARFPIARYRGMGLTDICMIGH